MTRFVRAAEGHYYPTMQLLSVTTLNKTAAQETNKKQL